MTVNEFISMGTNDIVVFKAIDGFGQEREIGEVGDNKVKSFSIEKEWYGLEDPDLNIVCYIYID